MTSASPDDPMMIPLNDPSVQVRVITLFRGREAGPFAFLQGMRSGLLHRLSSDPETTETAKAYRRNERRYQKMLADEIPSDYDAIISPPSRMSWQADPYRQAICQANPSAIDLTPQLTRTGNAFAGENATVDELTRQMHYVATGNESVINRLIIVDDTFTKGSTAAALVKVLWAHGLPQDCDVIVACPLWLDTFSPHLGEKTD